MKQKLIVGVDVSKATLDVFVKPADACFQIENNVAGFNILLKELARVTDTESSVLVVMEHTGCYSSKLETFLSRKGIDYCKVAALEIKRSIGIVRGKADKIDARRIADYGWMRREMLLGQLPAPKEIIRLKQLLALRAKFVRERSGYTSRLKEAKSMETLDPDLAKMQQQHIDQITRKVRKLEEMIQNEIKTVKTLQGTYQLLTSIKGVGPIVAAYMICSTVNFTRFENARKYNCYAGLAPFPHQSGTSIRGRSRVSHLANKEAKTLLNLAASCAIQHDAELKEYYRKRVMEGKKKMSCLNIIRSKLVARMFAVIKRQSPYIPLDLAA